MPLFKGRSSLLEVQNRALIKTAGERAARIEKLERELQGLQEVAAKADRLERELQSVQDELQRLRESAAQSNKLERELQARLERQMDEVERLTLERDFYSKKALALEHHNRQLTDAATKYSLRVQQLERELTETATKYALRAQELERELTETATKYALWGQKLEKELARIDPDGAPARRLDAPAQMMAEGVEALPGSSAANSWRTFMGTVG